MTEILVSIDGRFVDPERAVISIFDRGFLYGDSIYEVIRTYGGEPFALDQHLARLERSARLIEMEHRWTPERIQSAIQQLIERVDHDESYIRVIVTRGEGEIDLDPAAARDPHCVIIVKPFKPLPPELVENGASVLLVKSGRCATGAVPGGSKTGNYLGNILALGRARREGHHEAVLVQADGLLTEGGSSNIFIVHDGLVRTPKISTGILPGITREIVMEESIRLGLPTAQEDLLPQDLLEAQEAFLTSTLREVLPVVRVNDTTIGDGRPGPVTRRIQEAYRARTGARIASPADA